MANFVLQRSSSMPCGLCVLASFALGCASSAASAPPPASSAPPGASAPRSFAIPSAIAEEHHELHAALAAATKAGGKTGEAATAVAKLMHPHFVKEEQYALPPLALLDELSRGATPEQMRDVLALTDELKAELPTMLQEHQAIVEALKALSVAASEENKPEVAAFAASLMHHAMIEEQVMYPAALLVGEHVRLRSESAASAGR